MNTQEAIQAVEHQTPTTNIYELRHALKSILNDLPPNRDWLDPDLETRAKALLNAPVANDQSYSTLKPNDALALLNEKLADECDRFEHDTGLKLATIKVNRDKKAGDIFIGLQAHVR